jgi:hypothetical protein
MSIMVIDCEHYKYSRTSMMDDMMPNINNLTQASRFSGRHPSGESSHKRP